MDSTIDNYQYLKILWEWLLELWYGNESTNSQADVVMKTFDYVYGCI